MSRKILASGLVRKLEVPDPEGAGAGPDVAKVKEAIKKEQMKK